MKPCIFSTSSKKKKKTNHPNKISYTLILRFFYISGNQNPKFIFLEVTLQAQKKNLKNLSYISGNFLKPF